MRNAVIRKKRLKAERIVDDYMRMPQRIITGTPQFSMDAVSDWSWAMPTDRDLELSLHTATTWR